jgi:hypothetical protein
MTSKVYLKAGLLEDMNAAHTEDKMKKQIIVEVVSLMLAAARNRKSEVTTALLKAGSNIEARDSNGMTQLMHAAKNSQNLEVVTIPLKAGADTKAKDVTRNRGPFITHKKKKLLQAPKPIRNWKKRLSNREGYLLRLLSKKLYVGLLRAISVCWARHNICISNLHFSRSVAEGGILLHEP